MKPANYCRKPTIRDADTMTPIAKRSVFGVASSRFQANRIVNHLANAGFSRNNISVLVPDEGARRGSVKSGWLSGDETRAADGEEIPPPRFNPFMAGGSPAGGLLRVARVAPASHGTVDKQDCGNANDHVLICLRAQAWREAEAARKIFQALGASNVTLGGEKAFRLLAETFQRFESQPQLQSMS